MARQSLEAAAKDAARSFRNGNVPTAAERRAVLRFVAKHVTDGGTAVSAGKLLKIHPARIYGLTKSNSIRRKAYHTVHRNAPPAQRATNEPRAEAELVPMLLEVISTLVTRH